MRYLLDTHTAFWYFEGSTTLSKKAKAVIDDDKNEILVSIVSAWEIAIKHSLHREETTLCSVKEFFDEVESSGLKLIGLEPQHVRAIEVLPYHHRDPFDRLLIATAIAEDIVFVSADANVPAYDVKWLW
ncbi:MAG: type II toxin-antitoxin system VapC family toxin [Defluviitaleaceae bacterium]|nr:type II toxin-antitoxin system VapC family toxin [Defluviitaleaceae bacterium]